MQREFARGPVEGAPQCLAVDRHHALQAFGEVLHKARETGFERRRIEEPEHSAEGVVAGDAVPQAKELPQERLLNFADQRHVRAVLAAGQHGAECDQQKLMQVVAGILPPGIDDLGEAGDEFFHSRASTLNPRLESCHASPSNPRLQQPAPYAIALPSPGSRLDNATFRYGMRLWSLTNQSFACCQICALAR